MLKRPSNNWVEKPGNPNILVHSGAKQEEENNPPPPPVLLQSKTTEEEEEEEEKYFPEKKIKLEPSPFDVPVGAVLYEALQPFYLFVGMVEAESGIRVKYRWVEGATMEQRMIPLHYGAKSVEEFRNMNAHLGKDILNLFYSTRLIGANGEDQAQDARVVAEWIGCLFKEPIFQFILNQADFGALQLAAHELGFPLKDLIWSKDVSWRFAEFVGRKFFKPKQNAFAAGIQGGQVQYRIASGAKTTGQSDSKWIMGLKLWFNDVYYARNPEAAPSAEDLQRLLQDYNNQMRSLSVYEQLVLQARQNNTPNLPMIELEFRGAQRIAEEARRKYLRAETLSICYEQRYLTHPQAKLRGI